MKTEWQKLAHFTAHKLICFISVFHPCWLINPLFWCCCHSKGMYVYGVDDGGLGGWVVGLQGVCG